MLKTGLQLGIELAQVLVQHRRDGRRRVAVHVDERVERAVQAGEEPVDRPLLVSLDVILIERLHEVVAQVFHTEGLSDEAEVLLEMLLAEGCTKKLPEARDDVILEPVTIHDRDDVVGIRHERRSGNLSQVVLHSGTLVGENQAGLVDAVSAEHAAHRVRDQVLHGGALES